MNSAKGENPRSILIVKLSAIGDVVQTFPMVKALKNRYPEARIDWLVEEDASDLLFGHPALNRVIVSRRKSWLKSLFVLGKFRGTLREIRKFIQDLRSEHYDWVIDNHGIFKSGLLLVLSRGRRKIGFQPSAGIAEEGYYLFANERYRALSIERHALDRYLDLDPGLRDLVQLGALVGHADLVPDALAAMARIAEGTAWNEAGLTADPIQVVLDIRSYYEELAVELADGPPGPWAAERWFFDETEAGKTVLEARRAMKAAEAPFPLWFYMAPATRS